MWIILGLLLSGTIAGFLLSKIRFFNRFADGSVRYIIFVLLFFMGITIGMNEEITNNIGEIGLHSFIITALSITGSIFLAKTMYNMFFRKDEK